MDAKDKARRREYQRIYMRQRRRSDEPWPKRRCDHCRKWFEPQRSTARFCSAKCRVYANRANAQED
jgi:hypothetical protein